MTRTKRVPLGVLIVLLLAAPGCGSVGTNGDGDSIPAQLESSEAFCFGQAARLPASRTVQQTVAATPADALRNDGAGYVAYTVSVENLFLYLSFEPTLPASFTTEQARAAFRYAYVDYQIEQPKAVGGRLGLLSSNDLLALSDFERLELKGGVLSWRLVRTNPGHYTTTLGTADLDPSVDPESCFTGDSLGTCFCEFSGPETTVALDGTFAI
ncbi:MAG: hypothetical protein ABI488_01550 [Polyangiaceae bacterium]